MSLEYSTTIVWTCDKCGAKSGKRDIKQEKGDEPVRPGWGPQYWLEINGLHFCAKHRVKVVVDGKKVADWRATE